VLRAAQPDMKLVVIMREPVERMYSAYWYYGCMYGIHSENGLSADGFDSVAVRELSIMNQCLDSNKPIRRCARELFHSAQQLVKGIYAAFVPDWLAVYPRDQIMWIRAEDYYANERAHLKARPAKCLALFFSPLVHACIHVLASLMHSQTKRAPLVFFACPDCLLHTRQYNECDNLVANHCTQKQAIAFMSAQISCMPSQCPNGMSVFCSNKMKYEREFPMILITSMI
jgi:hypothetical protein